VIEPPIGDDVPAFELPASKNRLNRVGDALRNGPIDEADESLFRSFLAVYGAALDDVGDALRAVGFEPTSRVKNRQTIIEKLNRQTSTNLTRIRDIAGCRVVLPIEVGVDRQDEVVKQLIELFGHGAKVIDRRAEPMAGYRAVHLEIQWRAIPIEVQVRTAAQHLWAEAFERFGDRVGREIRYPTPSAGAEPIVTTMDSDSVGIHSDLIAASDLIDSFERLERGLVERVLPEQHVGDTSWSDFVEEVDGLRSTILTFLVNLANRVD
jgi:hypothetical protein